MLGEVAEEDCDVTRLAKTSSCDKKGKHKGIKGNRWKAISRWVQVLRKWISQFAGHEIDAILPAIGDLWQRSYPPSSCDCKETMSIIRCLSIRILELHVSSVILSAIDFWKKTCNGWKSASYFMSDFVWNIGLITDIESPSSYFIARENVMYGRGKRAFRFCLATKTIRCWPFPFHRGPWSQDKWRWLTSMRWRYSTRMEVHWNLIGPNFMSS